MHRLREYPERAAEVRDNRLESEADSEDWQPARKRKPKRRRGREVCRAPRTGRNWTSLWPKSMAP